MASRVHRVTGVRIPLPAVSRLRERAVAPDLRKLEAIDVAKQEGIGYLLALPQMVILGDPQFGKFFLIKFLTGVSLPKAPELRACYPIEIICRPGEKSTRVTFRPCLDANDEKRQELYEFSFDSLGTTLSGSQLQSVVIEATRLQGLRTFFDGVDSEDPVFSEDVLTIQQCREGQPALTLVDVPGMFENFLSKNVQDVGEVHLSSMIVNDNAKHNQSLNLVVLPGILNATTDRLLTCALELDPQGMRTIVVIPPTDPRDVVPGFDPLPVLCQRYLNRLRHGFFVITEVKSSSPDQGHVNADGVRVVMRVDYHLNNRDNVLAEPVPHSVPQVVPPIVSTTYGGEALCQWLSDVLIRHASYYYAESLHRLKVVMSDNEDLTTLVGPPRPEFEHRRSYIQGIIRRYERMVLEQLNVHGGIPMLEYYPYVTLTRRVQELHDAFARALSMENAHEFQFQLPAQLGDDPETDDPRNFPAAPPVQPLSARDLLYPLSYNLPGDDETPELNGVISAPYEHQQPSEEGLLKHIIRGFLVNRDIFGGSPRCHIGCRSFVHQTRRWLAMSRAHVSNIIIVVHHFILQALRIACPVSSTWTELLSFIIPRLRWIYARALHRTSLLVTSEIYRHFSIGPARLQHTLHSLLEIFTGGTAEATLDALFEGDYGLEGTPVWESLTPVEQESCVIVHHVVYVKCHDSRRFILDLIKRDVVGLNLLSGPSSAINVVRSTLIQSMEVDDIDLIGADDFDSSSEFTREDLRFKLGILRRSLDILESAGQVCAHTTESGRHADAQRRENLGHTAMDVDED